jgi:hypothetical protein
MASRKALKEQRRREREEAERREAQYERRRRRLRISGGLAAAVAAGSAAAALIISGGGPDDPEDVFAAKPDGLQDRVSEAGLTPGAEHFHPIVRVVANGQDIPIPDDIGVDAAGGHAPVHRHAGDEQLHAEGLQEGNFTLGQFMRVWGVPFGPTRLGPYRADARRKVMVLVMPKGQKAFRESRKFGDLQLRDGDEIYVVYGTPEQSPVVL